MMDIDRDIGSVGLWVLSFTSVDRLGLYLDRKMTLRTEDGGLRDWRGLLDHAGFGHEEKTRVQNKENKKTGIIFEVFQQLG